LGGRRAETARSPRFLEAARQKITISSIPVTLDDGGTPRSARGSIATMGLAPEMAVAKRLR
jgi:hypothetical protein